MIKRVRKGTTETSIAQFLSSEILRSDPDNHCVPILDIFCDESDPAIEYLVMPILKIFNSPPFYAVSEVVDFIKQTLEVGT